MILNKHCLVTGGAGFIGSHLTDKLIELKNNVIVLDDFSNGYLKNLERSEKSKNLKIIKGSVINRKLVEELIVNKGCDYIFHLAAGNLLTSLENPKKDISTTILGMLNILESIKKMKKRPKLIFSSTGSVYGEPKYQPQDENHPLEPVSPYGISKLAAEKYVLLWNKLYGLNTTSLRYYNVYGPRQNSKEKGGVIPIFITRVAQNFPPIIEGTGKQERCFTYVDDVVRANILAAISNKSRGEIFNIGTTEITSVNKLANLILKEFNSNLKPNYTKRRTGDIDEFRPNIKKAERYLKYIPRWHLDKGLKITTSWYLRND